MGKFRGEVAFQSYRAQNNVKYSLREWIDIAMLEAGAYNNISLNETDIYGNDISQLAIIDSDGFSVGQVWKGRYSNWVYESGVSVPSGMDNPIHPSGVYVGGTFYPIGTSGTYSFHVDYINGRVVFDNPISSGMVVKCPHSYKMVYVGLANREEALEHVRLLDENYPGSGWKEYPQPDEIYFPAVFIEVANISWIGAQLGGGKIARFTTYFHVFCENDFDLTSLSDMIGSLQESSFPAVDWNNAPFPLDEYNDISDTYIPYDIMAASGQYKFRTLYFLRASVARPEIADDYMYTTVGITSEIYLLDI